MTLHLSVSRKYKFDTKYSIFFKVFRALEYPAEMAKQEFHRERLVTERWNLIRFVSERSNSTDNDDVEKLLSDHLAVYERVSKSNGAFLLSPILAVPGRIFNSKNLYTSWRAI